jgi:hypothetical protein
MAANNNKHAQTRGSKQNCRQAGCSPAAGLSAPGFKTITAALTARRNVPPSRHKRTIYESDSQRANTVSLAESAAQSGCGYDNTNSIFS